MTDLLSFLIFLAAVLVAIYFVSPESTIAKKIGAVVAVALPAFHDQIARLLDLFK